MRSIVLTAYGEAPYLTEVAMPEPGTTDVLVRVVAASLNPLDNKLQAGYMDGFFPLTFPSKMGTDVAGIVEKTGSLMSRWRVGDRVVARLAPTAGGAFAEFALVPEDQLVLIPEGIDFDQAAGMPTAAATAWQALFETAGLTAGQTVLIHAGAGGVGSFAIQFAHAAGARVVATASGDGIEIARRLGADQVIDYRAADFASAVSDADVVLDTIGGDTQQKSFGVLRRGGKLITIVSPPDETLAKAHGVEAAFVFHASDGKRLSTVMKEIASKGMSPLIDSTFSLEAFGEAFARQASGRARGKISIRI
ncbi:NADPH:quinone oxidoreductase [Rhizobium sp. Root274]|uniref:NADP-dependent oxidoreductase n=1 Tax=unclassified Rhizobium TaxID=2613769 RepID=UPI000714E5C0|nr:MULTISPECIES: NADP-dependent oxidoreductase [unclassified Rhizobium]KQW31178.1 NADPH:quinone oxidoreductase [Rhizobium sp. Root1240]KRD32724.1 NADPH:quinone oxidoreductase [Rhizobium sp. Root274]